MADSARMMWYNVVFESGKQSRRAIIVRLKTMPRNRSTVFYFNNNIL